jgi:hypothetical protein
MATNGIFNTIKIFYFIPTNILKPACTESNIFDRALEIFSRVLSECFLFLKLGIILPNL